MAQFLVMLSFRKNDVVWRTCLISTILVFCICCGAVLGQDRPQQHNGSDTPSICEKDLWCENPSSSQLTQSLETRDKTSFGSADSKTLQRQLSLKFGSFKAQEGPFNASKHVLKLHAWVTDAKAVSRTACNEVYYVDVVLHLVVLLDGGFATEGPPGKRRRLLDLHLDSRIRGVFSNRTGQFCATFCLGDPHARRKRFMTPARLAYKVEHPESTTFPHTLVKKDCEIHIELEFPKASTIVNPLVSGVMTSLRSPDDPSYFHPLTISGMSTAPYEFNTSVQAEAQILGASAKPDISVVHRDLKVWSHSPPFCPREDMMPILIPAFMYNVIWNSSCSSSEGGLCSPFPNINISRIVHSGGRIRDIQCSPDWRVSAVFEFRFTQSNVLPESKANESSSTATTDCHLFAEGYWNFYKPGQLVMVAHYLASDGTPLDSKILITLQIPMARTIHHRFGMIGHVRSTREALDPLYFASFSFVGDLDRPLISEFGLFTKFRFSYDYDDRIKTKIQPVCSLQASGAYKNARFPDGSRATDLEVEFAPFDIPGVVNSSEQFFILLNVAVEQKFSETFRRINANSNNDEEVHSPRYSTLKPREIPVSFTLLDSPVSVEMEGFYDSITGHLCLLGCRRGWENLVPPYEQDEMEDGASKCDLVFSIQYPPTNPRLWAKSPFVTGIMRSLHNTSHPLYFEPLAINSSVPTVYDVHTRWTFLRRNAETIMSMASLSLVAFFTARQVGYSTRVSNSRKLSFVSLVMLAVLISGHFFPLLLSFNAFWTKTIRRVDRRTIFMVNGWSEAQEVIVRGTNMVALLLELRLLQLVWRSRTRAETSTSLTGTDSAPSKVSDVPVLQTCLPLYGTMIVVVASVHWQRGPHQEQFHYFDQRRIWGLLWSDLQAFSGVILDLFLLPQVIANVLWDTQEKVAPLYPLFYLGMTAVRSVEHLFDAARALNFVPEFQSWNYYFANPNWDLYSTTWDIIIPCLSVFLAIVLLLQQRYGGRCFMPKRLRRQKYQLVEFHHVDL